MRFTQTNIKKMLLAVMIKSQCVLIKSLVSLFKSFLGEDAVYSVINSMLEKTKYRGDAIKKPF